MQNKEECGSYFDVLQERLASPPMFTTLRLNTTKHSAEEIHAIISQELQKVQERSKISVMGHGDIHAFNMIIFKMKL